MAFSDWCDPGPLPSSPQAVHRGELPERPAVSVTLDPVILANARASLSDAQLLTAQGYHAEALLFAREALRKLSLALATRDRDALAAYSGESP